MSQEETQPNVPQSAASKLFDLRVLIGGLFTFYGVVLMVAGFFASAAAIQKASGININLWMGVGMLIVGKLFLVWWRLRPLQPPADSPHEVHVAPADNATPSRPSQASPNRHALRQDAPDSPRARRPAAPAAES
jgi:hypothetical protein